MHKLVLCKLKFPIILLYIISCCIQLIISRIDITELGENDVWCKCRSQELTRGGSILIITKRI